ARSESYSQIVASYGTPVPGESPLPDHVEVTRLPNALLVTGPEPMHFERLTVTAARSAAVPLRRRTITFSPAAFGAPDAGTFSYGGNDWETSEELRVVDGAVEQRTPANLQNPWELTVLTPKARRVDLVVRIAQGGSASVTATRASGPPKTVPVTRPPDGSPVLVKAFFPGPGQVSVKSVRLEGSGVALESVAIVEPFVPVPPTGDLRLANPRLPQASSAQTHAIDVIAFRDVSLSGWKVRWTHAVTPGDPVQYYEFGAGTSLVRGRIARIAHGPTDPGAPGVDLYEPGIANSPPPAGAVFQLVDPGGVVRHETAALKTSAYQQLPNVLAIPDDDGSRALLVSTTGTLPRGHWRVRMSFARDAGPGLPVLSVGGDTSPETAELYCTVD
ncbi:MAG TPA: hypothetical protein VHN37_07575, partial [Actinomycetota bacterium]|nr:hypothetical protein [Actinomycetota bacterium]